MLLMGTGMWCELTGKEADDAQKVPDLLKQIEGKIHAFCADGVYDRSSVFEALKQHNRGEEPIIIVPPRKDAVISKAGDTQRDKHIAYIKEHGQNAWEKDMGYGAQSKVENAMYRYKTLIGRKLRARKLNTQKTESKIGVKLINWMTSQSMPVSKPVI